MSNRAENSYLSMFIHSIKHWIKLDLNCLIMKNIYLQDPPQREKFSRSLD